MEKVMKEGIKGGNVLENDRHVPLLQVLTGCKTKTRL